MKPSAAGIPCPPYAALRATFAPHPAAYAVLCGALGLATPFAFAPYYHFWLMPCLIAAVIVVLEHVPHQKARLMYFHALCGYSAQFWWIHTALHDVSGLPNAYAIPLTLLLPAYLALYPACAVWLADKSRASRTMRLSCLLPFLLTLAEFARERFFTGFGWGAVGYSQIAPSSPLAHYAPLGGIHLVTLFCLLCGTWAAWIILAPGRRSRLAAATGIIVIIAGGMALSRTDFTRPDGSTATVALVQANVAQSLKFSPDRQLAILHDYAALIAQSDADIIILPETAIPLRRDTLENRYPGLLQALSAIAQDKGAALATGIIESNETGEYFNAVIDLSHYPQHIPPPRHAKRHLVPFGEYRPLPAITEPLYRLMDMPLSGFTQGSAAQAPLTLANQKTAFNICYEDSFGDELIPSAKTASLLANVSNMGWYGHSHAMYQHLQQSQTRALELGRYMVRATNNGATAIIDPKGRITAQAPAHIRTVLHGSIAGYHGETPYMRMGGSWPLILILAVITVIIMIKNYYTKRFV